MQMCAHVCIIRKLIWIFFESNITLSLTISVEVDIHWNGFILLPVVVIVAVDVSMSEVANK